MSPGQARVAYLDSSAIVKTIVREPETRALLAHLRSYEVHASSALARAEVLRAVTRADVGALPDAHEAMRRLSLVELTDDLLDAAGSLEPRTLRTLDAIHLVSARTLSSQLGSLVTYDRRMATAAEGIGLPVHSPS